MGEWFVALPRRNATHVFVVTFDPEPEALPPKDDDVSEVELVVVTAWRIRS
jgi:hypothetical protein